ncbi:MAG: cobalt ECF transporter T component CbiQ [Armatimonadota bacterium]
MFHLFSDIFACRDNALARMDPRAKLVIAFVTILLVIMSTRIALPLVVLIVCLGTMLALKLPAWLVLTRIIAPTGIVLALVVLQSLTVGSTPIFSVSVGAWHGTVKYEGIIHGLLMGSRVLGAVSMTLLLSSVTPAHKIFHALRWFRVSKTWVEIAMLMYRYSFALLDHTADVAAAQRLRLGYCGVRRSLSSMGVLAGAVIVQSLDQAARTHQAMTLRGYIGVMPYSPTPVMSKKDRWIMVLTMLVIFAAYALLERRLF